MVRRRLTPEQRRAQIVEAGAGLFADRPYEAVLMEEVAAAAGISRALLYRHFPAKRDLFVAVYEQAAARLLVDSSFDPELPVPEQISAALDTHLDYFEANPHAVLAANKVLAADPTVQGIIAGELGELRRRLLDELGLPEARRAAAESVIGAWLTFVRVLTVDWLENRTLTRADMHAVSTGALVGALAPLLGDDA
ncbi:TetR/AcrR family transcriptional regulator [Nocardia asteroides]|uniref:TetR/AcrR family transcriptional regulator n=1 Tax=Nocardia asteroides TaxID=1824 RepID=UPI001E5133AE|nr:TetR/AcrR family transcriptional regulator [Nocardia asteroides]UGT63576.1 TetR/AcrR family transcriptional regulator [Nocardia asteroides]